jgi:hypothetical protein
MQLKNYEKELFGKCSDVPLLSAANATVTETTQPVSDENQSTQKELTDSLEVLGNSV